MTKEEALKIIKEKNLNFYNFFQLEALKADEVCIGKENSKWIVFLTTERAGKFDPSIAIYDNENNAFEDFIKRLRSFNENY
ncbi:hypothetical protein [Wohlfahrtiimonas populi]|uniref:hypothetical protein n=1 Tax=Wohlfahrtiimonas populi TaxID=1940240 RepID=UPI00098D510D|nr:hypothetical protein [Wohlfahrtiimonas populi]